MGQEAAFDVITGEVGDALDVLSRVEGWSWVLWLVVLAFVVKSIVDLLAESFEPVRNILGWYGRHVASRKERRQAKVDLTLALQQQYEELKDWLAENLSGSDQADRATHLAWQLRQERWRAELVDAYLYLDAEFHRNCALMGIKDLPPYTSFQEFERQWSAAHPRPIQYDWDTGTFVAPHDDALGRNGASDSD